MRKNTGLINSPRQIGGGAWSSYSDGNDYTHDLLIKYQIYDVKDDHRIKNKNLDFLTTQLDKMYKEFLNSKESKNYPPHYAYFGVIIYMLFHLYPIPQKFLVTALFDAYQNYISVYLLGPASSWFDYVSRLECMKIEILLLNLAINMGTPINLPTHLIESDESGPQIKQYELGEFIQKNLFNLQYDWMDHLFIKYQKIKPEYEFQQFSVLPLIDPNLLQNGVVMIGYEGLNLPDYYVVNQSNSNKKWHRFDSFEHSGIIFLDYDFLFDLYGDFINQIAKMDFNDLPTILRP